MTGHTTDVVLLIEFVAGLTFIAGLYVYQGWETRRLDAVSVLFALSFLVLAAIFAQPLLAPHWDWLRRQGDLQPVNRAAFAATWNLLLVALVRDTWKGRNR